VEQATTEKQRQRREKCGLREYLTEVGKNAIDKGLCRDTID
jgi:hypothetical protein